MLSVPDMVPVPVAEAESPAMVEPLVIDVSVEDIEPAESADMVVEVDDSVDSVFLEEQAVAIAMTDITKKVDFTIAFISVRAFLFK